MYSNYISPSPSSHENSQDRRAQGCANRTLPRSAVTPGDHRALCYRRYHRARSARGGTGLSQQARQAAVLGRYVQGDGTRTGRLERLRCNDCRWARSLGALVTIEVNRYVIYLADLNPTRGAEIAKTRPVVVV